MSESPDDIVLVEMEIIVLVELDRAHGGFLAESLVGNILDVRDEDMYAVILKVLNRLKRILVPVLDNKAPVPVLDGIAYASWIESFSSRFPGHRSQVFFLGCLEHETIEGMTVKILLDPSCPELDLAHLQDQDEADHGDDEIFQEEPDASPRLA